MSDNEKNKLDKEAISNKKLKKQLMIYGSVWSLAGAWAIAAANGTFSDEGLNSNAANAIKTQHPHITPTEVSGFGWFGCDKGDFYSTKFKAVDQNNKEVSGIVCKNLFGNTHIKFNQ